MYIESVIMDGFKSYGNRTEIKDFDPQFNAITGLNGSGKSNILDAICFLLGITNLSQVRANNLQDLVYKSGQAGITKATVTVCFNNQNKSQSPVGYEEYKEISVTRQVVIGGKNKYMINGTNVQNNRVQDLFRSVQLNVNNPHFLIMQGRITKVLNMKPPEILSMLEEAAGTRMYETKKQVARKTLERKDEKLRDMDKFLREEVTPNIMKLKEERSKYLDFQNTQRELDHLNKLNIAWKFVTYEETSQKAKGDMDNIKQEINNHHSEMEENKKEVENLDTLILELQKKFDKESGGKLKKLEQELKEKETEEAKIQSKLQSTKDSLKSEQKKKQQLEKSLKDDLVALANKEKESATLCASVEQLCQAGKANSEAVVNANKKFQAISKGLYSNEDGVEATLQEQLMTTKNNIANAKTEKKQAEMKLRALKEDLTKKKQEAAKTHASYQKDMAALESMEKEVKDLKNTLTSLNYDENRATHLQERSRTLNNEIRLKRRELQDLESKFSNLVFHYSDPEPNFNRASVKGMTCKLFRMRDRNMATALEVAAGGRLYNVVVDKDVTGKKILEKGQLRNRVTIIPLNKITYRPIDQEVVRYAQRLVGKENVTLALDLIEYHKELHPAMGWIFGNTLICKDLNVAKTVAFDDRIKRRAVTWDGDVVDPAGVLTGGSSSTGRSALQHLERVHDVEKQKGEMERELQAVDAELNGMQKDAQRYVNIKQQFDLKSHKLELLKANMQQTTHHKQQEEVTATEASIVELQATVKRCTEVETSEQAKVVDLEARVKDSKFNREKELKAAEKELADATKRAEGTQAQWKEKEQEVESLKLEVAELQNVIATGEGQLAATVETIESLKGNVEEMEKDVEAAKGAVKECQDLVKEQKDKIHAQMQEIHQTSANKDKLIKANEDAELEIKQLENKLSKVKGDAKDADNKVKDLMKANDWILEDRKYFGQSNTAYDFQKHDATELSNQIQSLLEKKNILSKTVNTNAMQLLGRAEEQYNDVMRRKQIVEKDRSKIVKCLAELDEKKKDALQKAWGQINKDFGSIFSMLLPGSHAKLEPPEGQTALDGLEVRIAFGNQWKESLNELSGGQRSLVALSLILALLLFKPAPIYILDEVDAALDLSHTQNIGHMIKTYFNNSQFIVVSLKDGMFNNANVLFKTKFVDGMSTVARTAHAPSHAKKK